MCRCMQGKGAKVGSLCTQGVGLECCVGKASRLKDLRRYLPTGSPFLCWAKGQLPSAHSIPGTDLSFIS